MKMKETVRIEGMMCGHCEAAVKKSLEALDGVDRAEVSHETGTAVLTLPKRSPMQMYGRLSKTKITNS